MFILQVPTTMPPGGPTTNSNGVDDLIGEVNRTTVPGGTRPATTTREPSPRDVIDTVNTGGPTTPGGSPQGGDSFSSQATGDSTRRFLTTASDGYWTYRTVSYLGSTNSARTILPAISRPPVAPPTAIPVTTPLPPGAPTPPVATVATRAAGSNGSWILRTNFARHCPRVAGFLSKGGGFLRGAGGLAGRALPYVGGALAALDVTLDWVNYSRMDSGGSLVARALGEAASQGVTLSSAQIASARTLADKDLSRPENVVALTQHLQSCGLGESDANTLVQAAKQQQEAKSSACTGAIINTTCTAGGAVIGAIIGGICGVGVFSIPGAILGACIGAAIGNLVGGVVNMFRSGGFLSSVGGFFRGFFGGR